jgi:hypothetical protein
VKGNDNGREFMYGTNDTYHQVMKQYAWLMASPNVEEEIKKTLRIIELVEKDITKEYYE